VITALAGLTQAISFSLRLAVAEQLDVSWQPGRWRASKVAGGFLDVPITGRNWYLLEKTLRGAIYSEASPQMNQEIKLLLL
jgi:hypothetical protein